MSNVRLDTFADVDMAYYPDRRALPPITTSPAQWRAADVKALFKVCTGYWKIVLDLEGTDVWDHPEIMTQAQRSFWKKADRIIGTSHKAQVAWDAE